MTAPVLGRLASLGKPDMGLWDLERLALSPYAGKDDMGNGRR